MKCLLVLLSIAALAWGQGPNDMNCDCGVFTTLRFEEIEVRRLQSIDIHDCDDWKECELRCKNEFETIINNGGLDYVDTRNGNTIGDECCHTLDDLFYAPEFDSHYLFAYARVCTGPWYLVESDRNGQDILCCVGGKYPGNCPRPSI